MISRRRLAMILTVLLLCSGRARAQAPVEVEPGDLARRKELVGREVIVDDRVKYFWPIPGKGIGEILLKRTAVSVTLPPALRYDSAPTAKAVRVQGILRSNGGKLSIEATKAPELFRSDVDRLKKGIANLNPEDAESRSGWGDWAARRAEDFADVELRLIADNLQAESISLELRKPTSRTPEAILALAAKARAKKVAEPEPSALVHLALNLRSASAKTEADYQRLADEVAANLPNAKSSANSADRLPLEEYAKDPASVYRSADTTTRAGLDRRLWTDAMTEVFRRRAADPSQLGKLADEAKSRLPDRPEVSGDLRRRFIEHSTANVTELRETAMLDLVRTYKVDLKQPEKAAATERTWLDHQRKTYLGANNSEQRVELAKKYYERLKDRATAAELCRDALKIDESNREAADLFQRMGYAKVNGDWRDPREAAARPAADPGLDPSGKDDPFLGLTPAEVKAQLGEPKYATRVATQGRVSLQWIYQGTKGLQYIDFLHRSGDAQPLVVGRFSVH